MLKKLKRMRNHCETDCAKSWKKWFHESDHMNYSSRIETKNAMKWSMQWNICAKCSQNFNANVTEKCISKFIIQNKKSFNVQKRLNFVKQSATTLKTKKTYENSQNESKTKIICLKNWLKCRRWSKTHEKKNFKQIIIFKNKMWFLCDEFFSAFSKANLSNIFGVCYSLKIDCLTMIIEKKNKKNIVWIERK